MDEELDAPEDLVPHVYQSEVIDEIPSNVSVSNSFLFFDDDDHPHDHTLSMRRPAPHEPSRARMHSPDGVGDVEVNVRRAHKEYGVLQAELFH